jgi:glyoxylase-like metal-dependent hydrolase (beta-lactamase superfamily II)
MSRKPSGGKTSSALAFDPARPPAGHLEEVELGIRRLILDNPGPFTCTGTCLYVVGTGDVAIIDPGPEMPDSAERLLALLPNERIRHIVITHTHRDHSPAARALKALTGAPIIGCGPHRAARELELGERNPLDASADREHNPDQILKDGDEISGNGYRLVAVETPGHTMNHLAFSWPEKKTLFSGDHVMAWSTSIVAPPDGSMAAYMASLEKLRGRKETVYWPGHGGPVREPERFLRGIIGHRRMREMSILEHLRSGPQTIPTLVELMYQGLQPALKGAAALSVFAHLEDLVGQGRVAAESGLSLTATYEIT